MATPVLVLNGPNLNLLGKREPAIYGGKSLAEIERDCLTAGSRLALAVDFRQTNHEGILVDWIQEAPGGGIVLNPGAYGHTSIALHDAVRAAGVPVIEVHLSNIYQREPFRHHSTISPVAAGVICGLGPLGYLLALEALAAILPRAAGEGDHAEHGGGGLPRQAGEGDTQVGPARLGQPDMPNSAEAEFGAKHGGGGRAVEAAGSAER